MHRMRQEVARARSEGGAVDPVGGGTGQPLALFTDLYELTMLEAYFRHAMTGQAVFSLFVRRLPAARNFLLACGLEPVLDFLETLRFSAEDLDYLRSLEKFGPDFLDWLRDFSFTGDVFAVPEGTPVFADEPILEIAAPIAEAQYVETFVINQMHLGTLLASKAARVVAAAGAKPVVDFGARRIHGTDAALKAARAFHIAGVAATSDVLAGKRYGLPVTGTMAHSFIQAHSSESAALASFAEVFPETVLLVDTYDTLQGVRKVVELAARLGDDFRVSAVRLDSGDLGELAVGARQILDAAGLTSVGIFASGGLDETAIAGLLAAGAPIDGFGVGTKMGVSADAPDLDIAYKLCEYAGVGRLKLSPGKPVLPGRKQLFRVSEGEADVGDFISRADEQLPGRALLEQVMRDGARTGAAPSLDRSRARAAEEIARLPQAVRALAPATPPYPVGISDELARYRDEITEAATR